MSIVPMSPILPPDQRPDWDSLAPIPTSYASERKSMIIGHRGAKGLAPENTLPAFQVAAELNLDGVEFDVQRAKDGALVVFHDEDVMRMTTGNGLIANLTLSELKTLDVGATFDPVWRGTRIPTLHETFEFLRQTNLLVILELKQPWRYPGIEAPVVALIREYDLVDRIQVRSFYHAALHTIYRIAPEIPLSGLWLDCLPQDDEVTFKMINAYHALYTPENIAQIHRRGQSATAWTVDDLAEAQRLIDAGIDGLTTNYPNRLLTLFET